LYSIQTESVWAFLYCQRQCDWCCVYVGTLKEYFMPILRNGIITSHYSSYTECLRISYHSLRHAGWRVSKAGTLATLFLWY
jgi:hypothetical protein